MLEIRVAPPRDALDRFEAAWNRAAQGERLRSYHVLSVEDLPALTRALSPARWDLLKCLRERGACSVYELARRLGRNYKNVHTDVAALTDAGVLARNGEGKVAVPWDAVRAELRF
ncbi:MAG TPA: MarR family transcriptional regulator [Burkholderiales bacterium]|nr:MarR family transcriptional regulator [Burkholderiales bacterium]